MFNKPNPYSKIQENAIHTATKEELTLMLYDGALKFANKALLDMEKNDIQSCNNNIQRTKRIIREFQSTLDMKYEISDELYACYEYIHRRLSEANLTKDEVPLNEAMNYIRLFRDTWKEVMKLARQDSSKNAQVSQ